ncbi:MAG: thioredoxin family protein, partial [Bacteroidetes bacterium]|nr:thioredoxin family protein [Bacteroidota bacterium]
NIPVYIYCLSGGRSMYAAQSMRKLGFKVTELTGGILKWRNANLPITPAEITVPTQSLTRAQFEKLLESDKLVLVDFYADWCGPCKRIKPHVDQLSEEMANKIVVLRINYDENKALCAELRIDAIPILQLYKAKKLCWTNEGYIEKAEIANWINKF